MIPVYQTRTGATGNCFAACIASIFEIPLSKVPDFEDHRYLIQLAEFLLPRDMMYIQVKPEDAIAKLMFKFGKCWHTIEGISTRGGPHAVVGLNGKIFFDPHPGAKPPNLVKIERFGLFVDRFSF